jgi:hypothetical protein
LNGDDAEKWERRIKGKGAVVFCEPRGIGRTRWTRKNGPNYVERSHALLGRTADTGRLLDVLSVVRHFLEQDYQVGIAGEGASGVIAAYAALLEPKIRLAVVYSPPASHMDADAPQFLNALRVCDIPDVLGMLAPRHVVLASDHKAFERTRQIFEFAESKELHLFPTGSKKDE